jgi:hypothetical protein
MIFCSLPSENRLKITSGNPVRVTLSGVESNMSLAKVPSSPFLAAINASRARWIIDYCKELLMKRINLFQKTYFPYLLIFVVFITVLSACGSSEAPASTPDINSLFTQVAATLAKEYTQTALAMPTATNTPEPTFTPLASPTTSQPLSITTPTLAPSPTLSGVTPFPTVSTTANGCYDAALVTDVTIPAGTKFNPGDSFEKTWRLKNTGTCDWNADFKITYVGGKMFGSDTTKIRQRVWVGNTGDISLSMVAPAGAGTVVSNWQMSTDDGKFFGPVLTVSIALPGIAPTTTTRSCYHATLVSDVTVPNGTEFKPGDTFTKTWEIKNSGTCDWNTNFKITYVGGNMFGSDTTKIRKFVGEGDTTNISLPMVAPSGSGNVTSSWQMATDSGTLFGQIFTVQIVLK